MIKQLNEHGFAIMKNAVAIESYRILKNTIGELTKNVDNDKPIIIRNLLNTPAKYQVLFEQINDVVNKTMRKSGHKWKYAGHSDFQMNTLKGWHRDSRNTPNPWKPINGEFHNLYRLLIYLEDYRNKSGAIFVIPRSHLTNNYKIPPLITKNPSRDITGRFINNIQDDLKSNINIKGIRLKIGDAVIIDHRILHRGSEQKHRAIFQYSFSIGKKSL